VRGRHERRKGEWIKQFVARDFDDLRLFSDSLVELEDLVEVEAKGFLLAADGKVEVALNYVPRRGRRARGPTADVRRESRSPPRHHWLCRLNVKFAQRLHGSFVVDAAHALYVCGIAGALQDDPDATVDFSDSGHDDFLDFLFFLFEVVDVFR